MSRLINLFPVITVLFMVTQLVAPELSWGGADESFVLENGLKVILAPQPGNPVITARVTIKAGSAHEASPKEYGLAHLMEHMAFKGSAKRKVGEISSLVENNGGSLNAYTHYDETCYHLSLPAEETELALDILADMVFFPTYDPKEYKLEKEVVVEEINRALDNPDRVLGEEYMARVFKGHPYEHMVLGSPESVRGASRETALAFHRKHYRPDNAFLVVSGGLDPSQTKELVAKYFNPLKNPKNPAPARPIAKPASNQGPDISVKVNAQVQFPKILLGFRTPGVDDSRASQLDLLSAILSQGRASRLYAEVKTKKGLVTDIDTSAMTMRFGGNFYIGFEAEPEKIELALAAIIEELNGLVANPPTDAEMERAVVLAEKAFILGQESSEGQNGIIASFELQNNDYRLKDAYLARWARLKADDLVILAKEIFRPDNLIAAIALPSSAKPLDEAKLGTLLKDWRLPEVKVKVATPDAYQTYRLDNGVEVLLLKDNSLPRVAVKVVTKGGLLGEKDGEDGLANFFAEVWPKSTQKLSVPEMALAVENLGASVDGFSGRNSLGLSGSFLATNWEKGLGLILDLVTEPGLAPESLEEVREEILVALKTQDEQMADRLFRLVRRGVFGDHPYHRDNLGLKETVAKFAVKDLKDFYSEIIRPETLQVAVAGDIDPQAALDFLRARLGSWRPEGEAREVITPAPPKPLTQTAFGLDNVERAQVHLAIAFLAPGLASPDQAPLDVLTAYLSGMGGVLFSTLRDQQSLAYVVTSGYGPGLDTGTFYFYIATDPQKTSQALTSLQTIINQIRNEPIDEAKVSGAKRYLLGVKKISRQTLGRRLDETVFNKVFGLGLDFEDQYLKAIEAVTPADLQRVAQKYLSFENAFFGAAGQGEVVEKAWAAIKEEQKP
ncbi:MAG: insulinase family protein [Deltaproteobacteria bacterium]|jgi:zinc protease|nr:insulinase family protein [Deltaproteobacteria bacterium]